MLKAVAAQPTAFSLDFSDHYEFVGEEGDCRKFSIPELVKEVKFIPEEEAHLSHLPSVFPIFSFCLQIAFFEGMGARSFLHALPFLVPF